MTVDITFYTNGDWGAGKGAALTTVEVDTNFYNLKLAVEELQGVGLAPESIGTIVQVGDVLTITGSGGTNFGSFTLPSRRMNPTGDWTTATEYAIDDLVYQAASVYACAEAHTAGTFSADLAAGYWVLVLEAQDLALNDLSDVSAGAPASGNLLVHNGTAWTANSNCVLAAGAYLSIGGTQVVGTQQAAIADTDTDTTNLQTAVNAILAALRTHGLIDT